MTDKKKTYKAKPAPKKKAPDKVAKLEARIDKLVAAINGTLGVDIEA